MAGKKTPRNGTYEKGKNRVNEILDAAAKLLIDSGYHNFSMRKVADAAGVRLGNLQYYFPSKEELVKAMLDRVIQVYLEDFEAMRHSGNAREQFKTILGHVITDLNTKKTTIFFPELWSLSNHEKGMTRYMDEMYDQYRKILCDIISEINPKLSAKQVKRLALFISSSIEGHTVFIGYRKPWARETKNILDMAIQSFLWLIEQGKIPE